MNGLHEIAKVVVGHYDLADVWAGLVACCVGSMFACRFMLGRDYANIIRLKDVYAWLVACYIGMRFSFIFLEFVPLLKTNTSVDSIFIGTVTGLLTPYILKYEKK